MSELKIGDAVNTACPWSGDPIKEDSLTLYKGAVVGFAIPAAAINSRRRSTILKKRLFITGTKAFKSAGPANSVDKFRRQIYLSVCLTNRHHLISCSRRWQTHPGASWSNG
ncbi:hypothetical protein SAMN05443582_102492 [Phyllobacterium sp. OV277]|nr:hypothetical protein SAMN05443582_102492 [Phyllobacterium sp. OV277]